MSAKKEEKKVTIPDLKLADLKTTHRYKKARGPLGTVKKVREEPQPSIIAVHEEFVPRLVTILVSPLRLHLGKPSILGSEGGTGIGLVNVENNVQKRRD